MHVEVALFLLLGLAVWYSEKCGEPSGLVVPVVRKRFRDGQAAHDDEGDVIDDPGLGSIATLVSDPRILNLLGSRLDQRSVLNQELAKHVDSVPIRTTCRCIAAFPKYQRSRHQTPILFQQNLLNSIGGCVPLVPAVPGCNQSYRIQKHVVHG